MSALLELRDVTKRFGGVVANDAISLSVPEGAIVGLIGPNGSGKTTLFNAITGAFPIDHGSVRFGRREISKLLTKHIAREGLIRTYQQPRVGRPSPACSPRTRQRSGREPRSCSTLSGSPISGVKRPGTCLSAIRSCSNSPWL